jgi:hypothetical protein
MIIQRGTVGIGLLALLAASLSLPASAFDDPKALVEAIYGPYQVAGQAGEQDPTQFYSERLRGLVAAHAATATGALVDGDAVSSVGDVQAVAPGLNFNPFIDAKHSLMLDLAIGAPVVLGEKAMVTVAFHNFDQATLLSLSLVRDPEGWKVDDVASLGQGENWLLSWLLQYDPFDVN